MGSPWTGLPNGVDNGNGTFSYSGSQSTANWDLNWNVTVDPDPFISAVFGFRNATAITQTFIIDVSLPIAPPLVGGTWIGGSIGLTLTDSNFDGSATVASSPGIDVYQGRLDGVTVLDLLEEPFSFSVLTAGGSDSTSDVEGLPGPSIPAGPVLSTISIRHTFTLTPGDSVGITSFFVVVPEVNTLALCGVATILAGLGFRVRRAPR